MEKSAFQCTNPRLERLEFAIHPGFQKADNVNLDIQVSVQREMFTNDNGTPSNQASVKVTLTIGSSGKKPLLTMIRLSSFWSKMALLCLFLIFVPLSPV